MAIVLRDSGKWPLDGCLRDGRNPCRPACDEKKKVQRPGSRERGGQRALSRLLGAASVTVAEHTPSARPDLPSQIGAAAPDSELDPHLAAVAAARQIEIPTPGLVSVTTAL